MEYDFSQFLKDSQEQYNTRDEFLQRISNEIKLIIEIPADFSSNLNRHAYLKRLEGAEFAAKYDQFKESDKYNEELMILLNKLV